MKLVATEYVTLDGFMDEPGLWSMPFFSEEAAQFKATELAAADALLLGRHTYEGFSKVWPTMTEAGEFAEKMNSMPKYVASRTLKTPEWNATVIEGDVPEAVAKLKEQDGGDLLLSGSCQLLDLMAQHDLIDEYRLMVHPIVLGDGKLRIFGSTPPKTLKLVKSESFADGIVLNTYHRA
jgi:dihydrofolate reductase